MTETFKSPNIRKVSQPGNQPSEGGGAGGKGRGSGPERGEGVRRGREMEENEEGRGGGRE